jgi:hypothetical protein
MERQYTLWQIICEFKEAWIIRQPLTPLHPPRRVAADAQLFFNPALHSGREIDGSGRVFVQIEVREISAAIRKY